MYLSIFDQLIKYELEQNYQTKQCMKLLNLKNIYNIYATASLTIQ